MQEFEINSNSQKYFDNVWEKVLFQGNFQPEPRSGHSSVMYQNQTLFIFGGYNDREALNDMYKFDISTHYWQKIEYSNKENEIPSKRASCTLVCFEDLQCLYLFGGTGHNPQNLAKSNLFEFSIHKQKWRLLKTSGTLPSERYGHSMNIYKNFIVIFGGVKFSNKINNPANAAIPEYLNDICLYSILDKRWISLQVNGTVPQPRHGHQSIIVENDIYIVGGSNTSVRFGNIHKYEFNTNKWIYINFENTKKKEKDILFKGRYCHGAVIDNDEIFIYGGKDDQVCDDILHLDLKTKTWNRKKVQGVKPESREFFSVAYFNRKMIIFGGRKVDKRLNDMHIWHISVPRASYKDCTLRAEIWEMSKQKENFSDVKILSRNKKEYLIHSSILKHRCRFLFNKIQTKENENYISLDFDDFFIEMIIQYIYSGEVNISGINPSNLFDFIKILSVMDLEYFLKSIVMKILNEIEIDKDSENLMNLITTIKTSHSKEKDIFIQNNENLFELILDWMEFKSKLLKNSYTKEENKEILNKILKFNSGFENNRQSNIQQFYEDLERLYADESTADFEININDKNYKVHKYILMARSNYFESIFLQETIENQKNILKMDSLIVKSSDIFEIMLRYFYLGFYGIKKLTLNFDSFNSLLQICNYFDVKCPTFNFIVEDKISDFLEEKNCIEILDMADKIAAPIIKLKTMGFIASRFQKTILKNEEFLKKLPSQLLVDLMIFYSKQHS